MPKHYTIEVPVNSHSLDYLATCNRAERVSINIFGGIPDSPFHGGRNNFLLDRLQLAGRVALGIDRGQLKKAMDVFYENIDKANRNGMPFFVVLTNLFVAEAELNHDNLYPIERLVRIGREHGLKNGVIINNLLLEGRLRQLHGSNLVYVSSCTKYCVPGRILTPSETLKMYIEDSAKYDLVVLTPQDSRREGLIRDVLKQSRGNISAICNSFCSNNCNSYDHYEFLSHENKKSLLGITTAELLARGAGFILPRMTTCSAVTEMFCPSNFKKIAQMQLQAGVVHFKLGRGFGDNFLAELIRMLQAEP